MQRSLLAAEPELDLLLLSANSMFSVASLNSKFAIGCINREFEVCF